MLKMLKDELQLHAHRTRSAITHRIVVNEIAVEEPRFLTDPSRPERTNYISAGNAGVLGIIEEIEGF
jgi:hypothetical protein